MRRGGAAEQRARGPRRPRRRACPHARCRMARGAYSASAPRRRTSEQRRAAAAAALSSGSSARCCCCCHCGCFRPFFKRAKWPLSHRLPAVGRFFSRFDVTTVVCAPHWHERFKLVGVFLAACSVVQSNHREQPKRHRSSASERRPPPPPAHISRRFKAGYQTFSSRFANLQ